MELLYSDIRPMPLQEGKRTIIECFNEQIRDCDSADIAVGYVSADSLSELDSLVTELHVRVRLLIGMYYYDGMPENTYRIAKELGKRWKEDGSGEVRISKAFKYHGKLYVFHRDGKAVSAIIGSANLGAIKPDASNRRQYEVSGFTDDPDEVTEIMGLIEELRGNACSADIADVADMRITREKNMALEGVESVKHITETETSIYMRSLSDISFELPLKVPAYADRLTDDNRHYTKSNLNVCYASPRSKRKSRDWYETQMTVSKTIRNRPGYPQKNVPFYVVTDDGYMFLAHTTSDGNKQFSAVGDELILGRWVKGRLAAAGLVKPVNDTMLDTDRQGMITQEMLDEYGCNRLVMTKTSKKEEDSDGETLDVWFLSFEA